MAGDLQVSKSAFLCVSDRERIRESERERERER